LKKVFKKINFYFLPSLLYKERCPKDREVDLIKNLSSVLSLVRRGGKAKRIFFSNFSSGTTSLHERSDR
jgi:hypothetical protein